jgi:hypothetical protein
MCMYELIANHVKHGDTTHSTRNIETLTQAFLSHFGDGDLATLLSSTVRHCKLTMQFRS